MARQIQYDLNVDADQAVRTVGQLEDTLTQLNSEIRDVDRNSDAFKTLSREIQNTTSELEGANRAIEGFSGEQRRKALQGSIDLFAGSITAIAGVGTQLGLINEESEEAIANLLATAAAASGVSQAAQGFLDLREALRNSTTAQLLFNAAANANPYAILATAVLALGAAYLLLRDNTELAKEELIDTAGVANAAVEAEIARLSLLLSEVEGTRSLTIQESLRRAGIAKNIEMLREELRLRKVKATLDVTEAENLQISIDLLNDEILRLGDEEDEDTVLGKRRMLINLQLMQNNNLATELSLKRELATIDEELDNALVDRPKNLKTLEVATAGLIKVEGAQIEQKEVEIRANDTVTDNAMGNLDAQVGALNDFATAAATLAEENKTLAIAAVITNAAVAGIGLFRSWQEGPFGPIGNNIALGASLGVLAASSVVAIDSINNADSGGGVVPSSNVSGPTTSIPNIQPMSSPLVDQSFASQQQVMAVITPSSGAGSLTEAQMMNASRQRKRVFNSVRNG